MTQRERDNARRASNARAGILAYAKAAGWPEKDLGATAFIMADFLANLLHLADQENIPPSEMEGMWGFAKRHHEREV